jgi:hypothetical protein
MAAAAAEVLVDPARTPAAVSGEPDAELVHARVAALAHDLGVDHDAGRADRQVDADDVADLHRDDVVGLQPGTGRC